MPVIAVFDTSVLLSALGWKGTPLACLQLAETGQVQGVTCREILAELAEKLEVKLHFSAEQVVETLADLLLFLQVVEISGTLQVVAADPDDDKVVECAVAASATHIVTGDRRHLLPLNGYQGIAFVAPAEFLKSFAPPPSP